MENTIDDLDDAVDRGKSDLVKKLLASLSGMSKQNLDVLDYPEIIWSAVANGDCAIVLALVDFYISVMNPGQIAEILNGWPPHFLRWIIIKKIRVLVGCPENIKSMFLDNATKLDPVQIPEEKKK
jgi:hypothetical protein